MARRPTKTTTDRIFDNILFLEEVFGDKPDSDIPHVPLLELAKRLEPSHLRTLRASRHWNLGIASDLSNRGSE
jgi:hypothetical protein